MRKKNKIKIIVNGKQMTVNLKFSLKNLIDKLKLPIKKVAIELNREIVNKSYYNSYLIKENDKIEALKSLKQYTDNGDYPSPLWN